MKYLYYQHFLHMKTFSKYFEIKNVRFFQCVKKDMCLVKILKKLIEGMFQVVDIQIKNIENA